MPVVSWEQLCLHFLSEETPSFSGLGSRPAVVGKEGTEESTVKPWTVSRGADHTCVRRDLTHPLTRGVIPQDFLSMLACLTV